MAASSPRSSSSLASRHRRGRSGTHMPRVIHVAATCHPRGSHVSSAWLSRGNHVPATWRVQYISKPWPSQDSNSRRSVLSLLQLVHVRLFGTGQAAHIHEEKNRGGYLREIGERASFSETDLQLVVVNLKQQLGDQAKASQELERSAKEREDVAEVRERAAERVKELEEQVKEIANVLKTLISPPSPPSS
ncbi:hypothetical protein Tco_0140124 [Tanacetum coccineum]